MYTVSEQENRSSVMDCMVMSVLEKSRTLENYGCSERKKKTQRTLITSMGAMETGNG